MNSVVVRVLGPVGVTIDGVRVPMGGPRQRLVVARLAASFGRAVPTAVIAQDVWQSTSATDAVKTTVNRLRKTLGPAVIVRDALGYAFDPAHVEVDACQFADGIARARRLVGMPREQIECFATALDLWDGSAYSGIDADGDQGQHTCAIRAAGNTMWCWGANTDGQLGDGTTTGQTSPVQVGIGPLWVMLDAGGSHTASLVF